MVKGFAGEDFLLILLSLNEKNNGTMRSLLPILAMSLTLTACDKVPNTPSGESSPQDVAQNSNYTRLAALSMDTPVAARVPHQAKYHGRVLDDPYHWLKDEGYPEVDDQPIIDYLNEENAYFNAFLAPHETLVNTLFEEFKGRLDETETSVPWVVNGYEYRWEFKEGADYRTYTRKNLQSGESEVFMDQNELAQGHDYFVVRDWDISPDNRLLAYSVNTNGDERFSIYIKDLTTGKQLADTLTGTSGAVGFIGNDALLYGKLEADRWFTKSLNVHKIGAQESDDKILLQEDDDGFFLSFSKTSSDAYFVLNSSQREITEQHALDATNPDADLIKLVGREQGFSASVDHAHGKFYILANDTHKNFRLVEAAQDAPAYDNWKTVIEASDNRYLTSLQSLSDVLVLKARVNGLDRIMLQDYEGESHEVAFPEAVYSASIGFNPEFNQKHIRINYESMITPDTVFDYDIATRKLETRKVDKIPSGYDKTQYVTERIMAPARDGTLVPVSIVHNKDFKKDGSQPVLLYGYGAYGVTVSPSFSTLRLSLLDRGFAWAIAHVRGSDIMGYQWYLDGKLDKRTNTFNDFVDVAKHLVNEKYTSEGNISIMGRSAGGELMGAAVIQAPDMWRSVNLGVPFVDVLNTMLDETLPLTPPEWKEWGNPVESAHYYDLLASYSPYDNIEAKDYPPMLVSGGLYDPRVTYWEPAKWTAKMRHTKTDNNLLVMRINMGAGHFANSGRYGRLKDYAEEYAFTLLAHDIKQ